MTSDGRHEPSFSDPPYYPTNEPIHNNHIDPHPKPWSDQTVPLANYPRSSRYPSPSSQYWTGHPDVATNTLPSAADTTTPFYYQQIPYYPSSHVTPPAASTAGFFTSYPYGSNISSPGIRQVLVNLQPGVQSLSTSNTLPSLREPGPDVGSTVQSVYRSEHNYLPLLDGELGLQWTRPQPLGQQYLGDSSNELTSTQNLVAATPGSSTTAPTATLNNTRAVEPHCLPQPTEEFRTNSGEISTHSQVDGKYPRPTSSAVIRNRKRAPNPSNVADRPPKRRNRVRDKAMRDIQKDIHDTQQTNGGEFFREANNTVIKDSKMTAIGVQQVYVQGGHPNDPALQWLKGHAMRGAEHDSGDRDPPPRCHPGTRTTIIQKAQDWLGNSGREKSLLWLRGTAGVGKSAIVQTLAETLSETGRLGASLFFSRPNGRDNPRQVLPTLAYQFAIQDPSYREYITQFVLTNPESLDKAMNEQFRILIVEPFVRKGIRSGKAAWAVVLDGLDECGEDPNGRRHSNDVQRDIVHLISDFVRQNPTAPLIWIIASRPETHLKAAFSKLDVISTCWEEEVPVDSDEACEDVEKFLHKKFTEIGENYPDHIRHSPSWPASKQFLKIAHAALGLFIFAEVIVRFIGDPEVGNPIAQLECVLLAISKMRSNKNRENPLANLDVIYLAILSKIPPGTIQITKRLLGFLTLLTKNEINISICNFSGMCKALDIPEDIGVTAFRHLHSVLYFPKAKGPGMTRPRFYHASFRDFLQDQSRSHEYFIDKLVTLDQFILNLPRVAQAQFSSDPVSPLLSEDGLINSVFVEGVFCGDSSSDGVRFTKAFQWITDFLPDAQLQPLLESLNVLRVLKYASYSLSLWHREANELELSRRGFLSCTTLGSLGIDWGTVPMSISKLGKHLHVQVNTTSGIQNDPREDCSEVQEFRRRSKAAAPDKKVKVWGHKKSACRVAVVDLGNLKFISYVITGIPSVTS